MTRLEQAEEHLLAPLDPADRAVLRELLRRLAVQAQSTDPVHDTCQIVTELAPDEPTIADSDAGSRRRRSQSSSTVDIGR